MEDLESSQRVNEELQPFSLLDVSNSDDDFLLDSSSEAYSLLDMKSIANDNQGDAIEGGEQIKQSNPVELQRPKKSGKCNLRKSLAWDSAFFTSAGVLEPEELSSIMEEAVVGVKKKSFLPGIEEDISKSTDSISTFESDLSLESIKADLFSDIRASIQRCTKPSTQENGKDSTIHDGGSASSLTKVAKISSGDTAKSKLSSKKLNSVVQPCLKSLKPNSLCKLVTKPPVRSRESSSSLPRRPVAERKPSLPGAVTIKRMSVGAGRVKSESNTAGTLKAGKAAPLQKAPLQAQKTALKKVAASTLPSASSVLSKATICSSRSSCDSSSSSSSEVIHKTLTDVRRKTEKNSNLPLGSKTRLPSRVAVRNKPRSGNSNLSDYLKSTSKSSPSISSASSISELSIDSCSSTATFEQKNIGTKPGSCSLDHNVNKSVCQNPESGPNYEAFSKQSPVQASTEAMVSYSHPGLAKPSGLRLPSAKIGFFDGVKAGTKTPAATPCSRSTVPSSLPRSTARISTPSGSVNKTKSGNTSAKVTPITARTAKPELTKTDTDNKPAVIIDVDSTVLQKALSAELVDEYLGSDSPNLAVGIDVKVAKLIGERKLVAESVSFSAEDGFNITDLSDQSKNVSAVPSSRAHQSKKCDIFNDGNQHSPLEVVDVLDLKVVNLQACDDACAKDLMDEKVKCMEAIDSKLATNKKEDYDSQSQNVSSNENIVFSSNPLKLLRDDDNNQGRAPFAESNSAVDTLMKVDVMPYQHEAEKENI